MANLQAVSFLDGASYIPPDSIFEVTKRHIADTSPNKVSLGGGVYRDSYGKPWSLPSVQMATDLLAGADHEYLPIAGLKSLREAAANLVFHGTKPLVEDLISSCQSLSGTGALHLAGLALKKANAGIKSVYITEPTWSNHELLFQSLGFHVKKIPYYIDRSFDFEKFIEGLKCADEGSVVVLHACAHNPTGCDPTKEQWKKIASTIQQRRLFPVFDAAYLGFNSGSVDEDAWAIKYFVEDLKLEAAVTVSFAKSMGLYGERVGVVLFVTRSPSTARIMNSILENVQRATVSSPAVHGARIASTILNTPEIRNQWAEDLVTMSSRIKDMRQRFYDELLRLQTPGDWSFIVKQTGMFGYTGISSAQIENLEKKYHVYMAETSRISIAGLNEGNIEYTAKSFDETVRAIA